jgi:hypothetical protein
VCGSGPRRHGPHPQRRRRLPRLAGPRRPKPAARPPSHPSLHPSAPCKPSKRQAKITDILSNVADRKPATINLDIFKEKAPQPNYHAPNYTALTDTFARAFGQADKDQAIASGGTWSINDMVKALQGSITTLAAGPELIPPPALAAAAAAAANATVNGTAANATVNGTAANGTANATAAAAPAEARLPFNEYAGNMFCGEGIKLANCSGVNPCWGHKCNVGSMCIVNMCGEKCTPKCISYAEIGAGVNKIMNSIGLSSARAARRLGGGGRGVAGGGGDAELLFQAAAACGGGRPAAARGRVRGRGAAWSAGAASQFLTPRPISRRRRRHPRQRAHPQLPDCRQVREGRRGPHALAAAQVPGQPGAGCEGHGLQELHRRRSRADRRRLLHRVRPRQVSVPPALQTAPAGGAVQGAASRRARPQRRRLAWVRSMLQRLPAHPSAAELLAPRFADLRTSTCKLCNPGFYAPSSAGNRYCLACPANT